MSNSRQSRKASSRSVQYDRSKTSGTHDEVGRGGTRSNGSRVTNPVHGSRKNAANYESSTSSSSFSSSTDRSFRDRGDDRRDKYDNCKHRWDRTGRDDAHGSYKHHRSKTRGDFYPSGYRQGPATALRQPHRTRTDPQHSSALHRRHETRINNASHAHAGPLGRSGSSNRPRQVDLHHTQQPQMPESPPLWQPRHRSPSPPRASSRRRQYYEERRDRHGMQRQRPHGAATPDCTDRCSMRSKTKDWPFLKFHARVEYHVHYS